MGLKTQGVGRVDKVDADMGGVRVGHIDGLCRALPVACRKHRDSMVGPVTGV